MKQEDIVKIPEIFKIIYEDRNYYIYSSTDVIKCFICKLDDHIAKTTIFNEYTRIIECRNLTFKVLRFTIFSFIPLIPMAMLLQWNINSIKN